MSRERKAIGQVTAADSEKGVTVHLGRELRVEQLRLGQFVVVENPEAQFFGTVSGLRLGANDAGVTSDPPASGSRLVREALARGTTFAECTIHLDLEVTTGERQPARTIPSHFSSVALADETDVQVVFGDEQKEGFFAVGTPCDASRKETGQPVCIDLRKFVERSNGIFGRSGTGKSMLARLLLCGVIDRGQAVNLIFDMHNEYATYRETEAGLKVKGLRDIFGAKKIKVYTLDAESSRRSGRSNDGVVLIPYSSLTLGDLEALEEEMRLSGQAVTTGTLLQRKWGRDWIGRLVADDRDAKEISEETGANSGSIDALRRSLQKLERFDFMVQGSKDDSGIKRMIDELKQGNNVILEFGRHESTLAYMLVSTLVTRQIHEAWVDQSERYERSQSKADKPQQLVITIEEAHKFLNNKDTIFGTIAREMRKYAVTLLIIDQRPSSIDPDVMSQLGTRVTALLSDAHDIEAVFTGVYGGRHLKDTLATLDTRQEALVFGHAVPMAVAIHTRSFDDKFTNGLNTRLGSGRDPRTVGSNGNGNGSHEAEEDLFG